MRIGIVSESSSCDKNAAVEAALQGRGHEIVNVGMKGPEDKVVLNYLHISFMAALLLRTRAVDFVVGGCGSGQGFGIACCQYPGIVCGHIVDPLDAWLFVQINNGNAISLELNKGYGWGADKNLGFVFDALFSVRGGSGYPEHRKEVQKEARAGLARISEAAHLPFEQILPRLDKELLARCAKNPVFLDLIKNAPAGPAARDAFLELAR